MRSIGIMQPYFLPYIGYFQLIKAVDVFVIYDNIQYTKKGWINRNRILVNGNDEYITLPLAKSSDYLNVVQKELSSDFTEISSKLIRKIEGSYKKAPYYKEVFPLFESIISHSERNLFNFILNSITKVNCYLEISTPIIVSSSLDIDHNLKSQNKVIEIVKALGGNKYINPIGGVELYRKEDFNIEGIELFFLKSMNIPYKQFQNEFVPFLSIVDVLMFNGKDNTKDLLSRYEFF